MKEDSARGYAISNNFKNWLTLTAVDLILVMWTIRAAVTYRCTRNAATIVATKAVGITFLARIACLFFFRYKMEHAVLLKLFLFISRIKIRRMNEKSSIKKNHPLKVRNLI